MSFLLTSTLLIAQTDDISIQEKFSYESLPTNYEALGADEKQALLWDRIQKGHWKKLPNLIGDWQTFISAPSALLRLGEVFSHSHDEVPRNLFGKRRVKIIHTFGVTAKIEYVPTTEGQIEYSGIYQSGAIGIVRFSLAGNPDIIGYTPGFSMKLLRDGMPSVNSMAMERLNGQGKNRNWFAKDFSTIIPDPDNFILEQAAKIFELVHKPATQLPVDHFARHSRDGRFETDMRSPHQLFFRPAEGTKNLILEDTKNDFRKELGKLQENATVYEVWARDKEDFLNDKWGQSGAIHIGNLVLRSKFVPSHYGDKVMFFQHYGGQK